MIRNKPIKIVEYQTELNEEDYNHILEGVTFVDGNKAVFLKALADSQCNARLASQKCGIPLQRHYVYMNDPNYVKCFAIINKAQNNQLLDKAKANLNELLEEGDKSATFYTLDTLGKNDGFTKKTETDLQGDININVVYDETDTSETD